MDAWQLVQQPEHRYNVGKNSSQAEMGSGVDKTLTAGNDTFEIFMGAVMDE